MTRRLTLRRRLVLGIVALLAAVTVVIGVVSVLALQGFLVARLDSQLTAATNRSQVAFEGHGPDVSLLPGELPPPSALLNLPGQRTGTLAGTVSGSGLSVAVLGDGATAYGRCDHRAKGRG